MFLIFDSKCCLDFSEEDRQERSKAAASSRAFRERQDPGREESPPGRKGKDMIGLLFNSKSNGKICSGWRKVLLVLKVILRYGHLKGFFICTRK